MRKEAKVQAEEGTSGFKRVEGVSGKLEVQPTLSTGYKKLYREFKSPTERLMENIKQRTWTKGKCSAESKKPIDGWLKVLF